VTKIVRHKMGKVTYLNETLSSGTPSIYHEIVRLLLSRILSSEVLRYDFL